MAPDDTPTTPGHMPGITEIPVGSLPEGVIDPIAGETTGHSELPGHVQAALDQFAATYPFPLDDFQRDAIATLLAGDSVMVAAPTGSGKTVVAEFGVAEVLTRTHGRVFYTTPIKALSNQKFRDLRAIYGDDVGLLTGDVSENPNARVVVMTTEVLRNMLLQSPWELDDAESVIFDEIHYLADPERGTTWEEAIILCPQHIQFICLSATVANADEIAGWISRTHRPIRLITNNHRPVPLALYFYHDGELNEVVNHHGEILEDYANVGGEYRRQPGRHRNRGHMRRPNARDEPSPDEIVDSLEADDLLPAIYFLFSRNDCEVYAERLLKAGSLTIEPHHVEAIDGIVQQYMQTLRPEDLELEQVQLITRLTRHGIAFHHAGLLPVLKQLVEVLFSKGLIHVVFATDTLALGVNMPARTVIIGRMSKWDGRQRRTLIPNEFQQMAGRAGRRGMDAFGHVVLVYSPWMPFREMLSVATGTLHPVQSAFAIRYNTVLNLWDPPDGDRVRQMLQRSLAQYQSSQRARLIEQDALEIQAELAGLEGSTREEREGIAENDHLFEEYRAISREEQAAKQAFQAIQRDLDSLRQRSHSSTPWTEPGRQAVRRLFRQLPAGVVVHLRDSGWAVYLGRGRDGGIGLVLSEDDKAIIQLNEYRQIDYVPDDVIVGVPPALIEPDDPTLPPDQIVETAELDALWEEVASYDLPDLEALATEHREREQTQLAARERELMASYDDARAEHRRLRERQTSHPFDDNATRKAHQRHVRHRDELHRERNSLTQVLERETEAENVRITGVIRGIRDILHRFGYLRSGYPTAKADMLADVFDSDGLILCELVDRGMLERLSAEELAEVFSWYSFDRDYRHGNNYTLNRRLTVLRGRLDELELDILGEERDHRLAISEGYNASFYGATIAWCRGSSMAQLGDNIELSEGDLVLTFNKTIDLMRQVREMLTHAVPDSALRPKLTKAENLLRRGIVEQSLRLGYTPITEDTDDAVPTEQATADEEAELVDSAASGDGGTASDTL